MMMHAAIFYVIIDVESIFKQSGGVLFVIWKRTPAQERWHKKTSKNPVKSTLLRAVGKQVSSKIE